MNIGIVTTWFPSGAGMVSKAYEATLIRSGNVFIFARGCERQYIADWDGKNVFWASPQPYSTGIDIGEFKSWIKSNKISIVLFNEQRHWNVIIESKMMGLKVGAYIDYYTADTIPFFALYDFLICNTKRHFSVFSWHKQVLYCPWGTDIDMFKPKKTEPRPLTFIISAGWDGSYAKGASWLDRRGAGLTLKSFSRTKGECKLVVLSQVPISECPQMWEEIVNNDIRIEFICGSFSPTPYHLGDVYVYPSRLDGIGLTLPEALSAGLPAITTDCSPMNEFVKNDINGTLVSVEKYCGRPDGYFWAESICNEESLIMSFEKYIKNPDLVTIEGKEARRIAEKELSWSRNSKDLSDFITNAYQICEKKVNEINGVDLRIVKRYDRNVNPTPIQEILLGIFRFYLHLVKFRLKIK
jgi:glycosyltransferase involved in cell wall biosynthesis